MRTYDNVTPSGLQFHLCLLDGVCCIVVNDQYDSNYFEMKYFTNVNRALRWINNL